MPAGALLSKRNNMENIVLRDAVEEDAKLIFEWRNDPWIIERGSLNKTVTWEEHSGWFTGLLASPSSHMFIVEIDGTPAGQVRFVGENTHVDISIYLLKEFIGGGMGVSAIRQACEKIPEILDTKYIVAHILDGNTQSIRAFEKAGFAYMDNSAMKEIGVEQQPNHAIYYLSV